MHAHTIYSIYRYRYRDEGLKISFYWNWRGMVCRKYHGACSMFMTNNNVSCVVWVCYQNLKKSYTFTTDCDNGNMTDELYIVYILHSFFVS